ncbi:MAG: hypothetical protein ACK519_09000 [Sphingomonadaceae bacterium]|jgi:hypothetical protein
MTQSVSAKKTTSNGSLKNSNGSSRANAKPADKHSSKSNKAHKAKRSGPSEYAVPSWLGALASVIGVGIAIGAGLYATRDQWMPKADKWKDDFSAAFADDETDHENFDQTRNAGKDSMRDHPGKNWTKADDMSDASFPASDPPSFTPATAS